MPADAVTDKDRDRWSREGIASKRAATQEAIAQKRLDFQREQAEAKNGQALRKEIAQGHREAKKHDLAVATLEGKLVAEQEATERSVKLEELQQAFYGRKLQLDYEYEAKYRNLNFQEYRLRTTEDIRHEKAVIAAQAEANIAEYKAKLSGEVALRQLEGQIERDRIREEVKALLLEIKAKLEAELVRKQQEHEHELAVLRAKHEYDMEMEILRDELRRQAKDFSVEEIGAVLKKLDGLG